MNENNPWLLPDGVDEFLPPEAGQLEALRRQLLDLFWSWGYELVIPPMIEYLDSLLNGAGRDLSLETVKVTDQLTGKLMGVRADITPQVARIDAHAMQADGVNRLCYASTVLRTRPQGLAGSRIPYQVGVEFFGDPSFDSDLEVITLMIEAVRRAGCDGLMLDLGHVELFKSLCEYAQLPEADRQRLGDIYQRKAMAELHAFCAALSPDVGTALTSLATLSGGVEVIARARSLFGDGRFPDILRALDDLERCAARMVDRYPDVALFFDLSELRGYTYHTGCVFAVFAAGDDRPVAKGGRYDLLGEHFGRSRPATGFSADLKQLLRIGSAVNAARNRGAIWVAKSHVEQQAEGELVALIADLRARGERVIQQVGDVASPPALCDREMVRQGESWQVKPIKR